MTAIVAGGVAGDGLADAEYVVEEEEAPMFVVHYCCCCCCYYSGSILVSDVAMACKKAMA